MIQLETEAAYLIVEVLQSLAGGQCVEPETLFRLAHHESLSAWVRVRGGSTDWMAEFVDLIRSEPTSGPGHLPEDTVNTLRSLKEDSGRLSLLGPCLERLEASPPLEEAEAKVLRMLPNGTPVDALVHVFPDGSGSYWADNEVILDLTQLPPFDPWSVGLWALSHELHHIGYDFVRKNRSRDGDLHSYPRQCARLLDAVISEGIANAYYTPCDLSTLSSTSTTWLAEVGPGPKALQNYLVAVADSKREMPALFQEFDHHLALLLNGQSSPETERYVANIKWSRPGLVRPLAHFLGEAMVTAIRSEMGDAEVVGCILDPLAFPVTYQRAAIRKGMPLLSDSTMEYFSMSWD